MSVFYSDTFSGSGALTSPWVTVGYPLTQTVGVIQGTAHGSGVPYAAVVDASTHDATVTATIDGFSVGNKGVLIRWKPGTGAADSQTGYVCVYNQDGFIRLYSGNIQNAASAQYSLLVQWAATWAAGDTLTVDASGTTLTVKHNGAVVGTWTDNTYNGANDGHTAFGVWLDEAANANCQITSAEIDTPTVGVSASLKWPAFAVSATVTTAVPPKLNLALPTPKVSATVQTGHLNTGANQLTAGKFFLPQIVLDSVHVTTDVPVVLPPQGLVDPTSGTVLIPPSGPVTGLPAQRAVLRVSQTFPAPTLDAFGRPVNWQASSETVSTLGWLRVIVDGRDVSFFRGAPVGFSGPIRRQRPFGYVSTELEFQQVSPHEAVGSGALAWMREGADVDVHLVDTAGHTVATLFEGFVIKTSALAGTGDGERAVRLACQGVLYQADHILEDPKILPTYEDLGSKVATSLNGVWGRRYRKMAAANTGIMSMQRSHFGDRKLTGFVQDLLATAVTENGADQWTVDVDSPRTPVMRLKTQGRATWTLRVGQPGVDARLSTDVTQRLSAVYGYGVDLDGNSYSNLMLPNYNPRQIFPPYPMATPQTIMTIGTTDSDTTSGNGVTLLQKALNRAGVPTAVTGVYTQDTYDAVHVYSVRADLANLSGVVAGATWTALFQPGADDNAWLGEYHAPFAEDTTTDPNLYGSLGQVTGRNRNYDPGKIRVETFHRFADGTTKADAARAARSMLARDGQDATTGTIVLTADPQEGSRLQIREGDVLTLKGWLGHDIPLPVIAVSYDFSSEKHEVTLEVDQSHRDWITLDSVWLRDRQNANPARRPRGTQPTPSRPTIDSEFIGVIPQHAAYKQLWQVTRIPLGYQGTIVGVDYKTSEPANKFVVAFFNGPITPGQLTRLIGDPLAARSDGYAKFPGDPSVEAVLRSFGWIDTIGGPGQAAGYYPGSEDKGTPITGIQSDSALGMNFESLQAPWIWVAEWCTSICLIEGQIRVAPQVV